MLAGVPAAFTLPIESMYPGSLAILRALGPGWQPTSSRPDRPYRDTGYLLVDALGGPIRHEVYSDRFPRLCRVAGVPVIRPHAVRHSLATILHEAGVTRAAVAAMLGHTLAEHLTTYVKLPPQGIETAAAALQQRLALPSAQ